MKCDKPLLLRKLYRVTPMTSCESLLTVAKMSQSISKAGLLMQQKCPLSKELYEKCCKWFLEKGDEQSIFCHTFLVITWNLMCRAKNTTRILWEHMQFDEGCLNIMFAQQKNDQNGQTATLNPRRVYANPTNPAVCPLFALSLYMATFGGRCGSNDRLFP